MIIKRSKHKIYPPKKKSYFIIYSTIIFFIGVSIQRFGIVGDIIIPYFKIEARKINNFIKPYDGETLTIDIRFKELEKLKITKNNALSSGLLQNIDYVSCKIKNHENEYSAKIRLKGDMFEHIQEQSK